MNRGSLITSKLGSESARLLQRVSDPGHANNHSPVDLIGAVHCAEGDMFAVKRQILVKHFCEPGLTLHGSYNNRLFGGRDCLREPAALCVSSCERSEKVRISATRKLHSSLGECHCFDPVPVPR